ncbi:hypothetical protein [Streptomyces youssoufiensis]
MSIDPGADELRVRELLLQRGVGPDARPPAASIGQAAPAPAKERQTAGPPADPDAWWDEIFTGPDATAIDTPAEPASGGRLPAPGSVIDLAPVPTAVDPDATIGWPPLPAPAPPAPRMPIPLKPTTPPSVPPESNQGEEGSEEGDGDEGDEEKPFWERIVPERPEPLTFQEAVAEAAQEIHDSATQVAEGTVTDEAQRRRVAHMAHAGSAAAVGWWIGLGPWLHGRMEHAGADDPSDGIALGLLVLAIAALAEWATHGWRDRDRHPITRVIGWADRIPLATAVLALALYGPDAAL